MSEPRFTTQRRQQSFWEKIWRDKQGDIVIWQTPNVPIIAWAVLTVISIITTGTLSNVVWYIAAAVLAVWALLEIFKGADYFRRVLGVLVILLMVAAFFKVGY
jgi:hypothetical protein